MGLLLCQCSYVCLQAWWHPYTSVLVKTSMSKTPRILNSSKKIAFESLHSEVCTYTKPMHILRRQIQHMLIYKQALR